MTLCWEPAGEESDGETERRGRISSILYLHLLTNGGSHHINQSRLSAILPLPHVAEHSVKAPLLHTKGDRVSSGRSVRGGMRAFLFGAEALGRDLSGVHRSEVGGENTEEEEEEEEKDGTTMRGGAGGGSSTDKVRGPKGEKKQRSSMETSGEVKFGEMDVMSRRTEVQPRRRRQ